MTELDVLQAVYNLSGINAATSKVVYLLSKEKNGNIKYGEVSKTLQQALKNKLIYKEKNGFKLINQQKKLESKKPTLRKIWSKVPTKNKKGNKNFPGPSGLQSFGNSKKAETEGDNFTADEYIEFGEDNQEVRAKSAFSELIDDDDEICSADIGQNLGVITGDGTDPLPIFGGEN